jgi:hypothetical protein
MTCLVVREPVFAIRKASAATSGLPAIAAKAGWLGFEFEGATGDWVQGPHQRQTHWRLKTTRLTPKLPLCH